jgi:adenylate cyclase
MAGEGRGYATPQEEWSAFLGGTHPHLQDRSPLRFIPSSPRCKLCEAPFGAPGALILRRYGYRPWEKNPRICGRCFKNIDSAAKRCPGGPQGEEVKGGEVEISMLFADVRGSSKLARQMPVWDFTQLMNRFYKVSRDVLFETDAIIEKFVGDEVAALFVPFMTGPGHAEIAVRAARDLLRATGHGEPDGPWVPVGAGVHSGTAFVGMVGSDNASDFTALGDPVNVTAHLAAQAAIGEVLVTTDAAAAAGLDVGGLERRSLSLKGHAVDALVISTEPAAAPSG